MSDTTRLRVTGRQVFDGGENVPVAFYKPWAADILTALAATTPAPEAVERCEGCAGNFIDGYCDKHEPSFHGSDV